MSNIFPRAMTRRRPRCGRVEVLFERQHPEADERKAKKSRSADNSQATESLSLDDLTPEILCCVLGFLGPTSYSLISLSALNNHFRRTMVSIGNAMLPRAQFHFRKPLRPKSRVESSTSLFIRHARICASILFDLAHLRSLLNREPAAIQGIDVEKALNMALDLLEVGPALSLSLEKQILSTCGKCGGKSFKYSKLMLRSQSDQRQSMESLEFCTKHNDKLETSRLIMQTVVYRELQLVKELPSSIHSFVQKQLGMKHPATAGCF